MMADGYGIKELASGQKTEVDIVFVHGLFGHRESTWTGLQNKSILWPRDLLSADVPNARILTFGYDADVAKLGAEVTNGTMESHAADLCEVLARLRSSTDSAERPIIFVAHSLGGLVCAQVLVIGDRTAPGDNSSLIARHIQGMIFLGTPFRGSRQAKWGDIINNFVHIFGQDSGSPKVRDLQEKSEKLKILAEAFPDVLRKRDIEGPRIGVAFFRESLKYRGFKIVEEDSAWIPGRGDHATLRADHISICKFDSNRDEGYGSVLGAIRKFAGMKTKEEERSDDGGATFHNYGEVKNQVGRDQNIAGNLSFG